MSDQLLAVNYPLRYDRYTKKAVGDFVRVLDDDYSHLDGGLLVRIPVGQIGKVVWPSGLIDSIIMVAFEGKNYWVKAAILTRVEILDLLADVL